MQKRGSPNSYRSCLGTLKQTVGLFHKFDECDKKAEFYRSLGEVCIAVSVEGDWWYYLTSTILADCIVLFSS